MPNLTPAKEKLKLTKDGTGGLVDPTYFKTLVGNLEYLTSTRLDINFIIDVISWFIKNQNQSHLHATKKILKYIRGTQGDGIFYSCSDPDELYDYTNSDWIGHIIKSKSTTCYAF